MLDNNQIEALRPRFGTLQIICAAIPMGAFGVLAVLFFLKAPPKLTTVFDILALAGAMLAVPSFLASFIVPEIIQTGAINQIANHTKTRKDLSNDSTLMKLFGALQNSTIIKLALIEGAVIANIMFWFLTGSVVCLAAVAVGMALMVLSFLTQGRIITKIESMLETLRDSGKFET